MASNILPDAQAPINKCEVCSRGVDARFYCRECAQEMCKTCKTSHLRMNISRDHTIISIAKDKDTSIHEKDTIKITCSVHSKEQVQMYCVTCDAPVCHTCIADKIHNKHDFDKLTNVAERHKQDLLRFVKETKEEIVELGTSLKCIEVYKKDYMKLSDKAIDEINQQREEIKSKADAIADDMIKEVRRRKNEDMKSMDNQGQMLQKTIMDRKVLLPPCEEKLTSDINTALTLKSFTTDVRLKKKSSQPTSFEPVHPPVFVRSDVNDPQKTFGKLEDRKGKKSAIAVPSDRKYNTDREPAQRPGYKPTPTGTNPTQNPEYKPASAGTSVNISTEVVSHINTGIRSYVVCAVSDKEAWCTGGLGNGKDVVLVQSDGTVKKRVKLDHNVYDITVTMSGAVLYTQYNGSTIRQYSPSKVISNTGSYNTRGIYATSSQQLLVCLCKSVNDNKVVRMSLNGQIKQTIQYNKQNKPLFSFPRLVTENINEDICVVDGHSTVVVVNKDGEFRFKYPESYQSTHTIGSCGIACDKLGYILISDYSNSQVHLIDIDGKFVKFVLTDQNSISQPWGLSTDHKGQLWVCNNEGSKVTVYKYRS